VFTPVPIFSLVNFMHWSHILFLEVWLYNYNSAHGVMVMFYMYMYVAAKITVQNFSYSKVYIRSLR